MNPAPSNGDPPEETSPESSEPIEANTPQPPRGFPVTFSGVASFAQTGWGRLLGWQWMMALALGGAWSALAAPGAAAVASSGGGVSP